MIPNYKQLSNVYPSRQNIASFMCTAVYSPILNHFNSSLEGVSTIRAFNQEQLLIRQYQSHFDVHVGNMITEQGLYGWFGLRMNLIVAAFTTCVVTCCFIASGRLSVLLFLCLFC